MKGTAHGTLFALHLASPRLAACPACSAQGVAAHRVVGSTNTCFGVRCSGAKWVVRDNNCSMDRISVSASNTKTSHSAVRNSSDDRRSRHRSIRDRISSRRVIDRGVMSRGLALSQWHTIVRAIDAFHSHLTICKGHDICSLLCAREVLAPSPRRDRTFLHTKQNSAFVVADFRNVLRKSLSHAHRITQIL